jgi:spore germination protein KB
MLEKGKISHTQFFILVMTFEIGTSLLLAPFLMVAAAKQDAWISMLIGLFTGLLLVLFYAALLRRYTALTLVEISEQVLGKWTGKAVSLLFFFYFLVLTAGLLRIIGDFITTHIMPETPITAIEITFMLIVIYGNRLGLEVFSRTSEIVLPWIMMFFFLLVFMLLPEIELKNLFPLVEGGIKPIIKSALLSLGVPFADIVVFLMITPAVAPARKLGKVLFFSTLTGGMIIFVIVLMAILVLGPNQTTQLNYPIYVLAQRVNIGNFIQRIEVLSGGMVFIAIFIKTTISFYSLSLSFAQIFNLKEYKILSFPFGMIVVFFANIMSPNIIFFQTFLFKSWTPIVLIFGITLPLLLLGIDTIKNGINKRRNNLLGSR